MRAMWTWGAPALLTLVALGGCELSETVIPDGEDLLVVESILDAGQIEQRLLLHRTLNGRLVGGEEGARVRVRRGDGVEVVFESSPFEGCGAVDPAFGAGKDSVEVRASCYRSPASAGRWVHPGERYELLVETVDGKRLHGRTTVPGHYEPLGLTPEAHRPMGEVGGCVLPPDSVLRLRWSVASGAMAYLTNMKVEGLPEALAGRGIARIPEVVDLFGVSVSERDTTIAVPTDVGVFERDKYDRDLMLAIRNGFPEGARVRLTLGAMDRNYVNAARQGPFHPSGPVRLSSVTGDGVGVFGSLVPYTLEVEVRSGGGGGGCLAGG
jgi:hypothetical protein